jgi:hypothetical protein
MNLDKLLSKSYGPEEEPAEESPKDKLKRLLKLSDAAAEELALVICELAEESGGLKIHIQGK